jgi:hypothetical protein
VIQIEAIEKNLRSNAQGKGAGKIDAMLAKEKKELILLQTNHDARYTRCLPTTRSGWRSERAVTLHQRERILAFRECEKFVP